MLLRRLLPALVPAVLLAGCLSKLTEEAANQPSPEKVVIATFDAATSTIPLPNDIALQRAPGLPPGLQKQLLMSFVANGGWPADQEVAVTIPVSLRTRQATGAYGNPQPPADLNLDTVNDANVAFVNIAVSPPAKLPRCTANPTTVACFEPSYASGVLTLRRLNPDGSRRWDPGAHYVVALRRDAITTSDGVALAAEAPIELIAPNLPLSAVENQPPGGIPDSNANGTNADEVATLEGLRSLYATGRYWTTVPSLATCSAAGIPVAPCWLPIPAGTSGTPALPSAFEAVSTVFPSQEIASIQTFTVQTLTQVRPITDSGSGQVPLPSDFLLDPATGKVRNIASFGPAAAGLATLDGFSTTAPLLIPISGPVKASTINKDTLRIYKITAGVPVQLRDLTALAQGQLPQIVTQPPTTVVNGAATTLVLAPAVPVQLPPAQGGLFVPVPPLDEKSQYLVIVTSDVKDAQDRAMKRSTLMDIIFTFDQPICEPVGQPNCTSKIPGVSNADAAGLQALRSGIGPVLDALNLRTCANNATCAVLAYTVKTQTVKDVSKLLSAAPYGIEGAASAAAFVANPVADYDPTTIGGPPLASFPNVAKIVRATFPTLDAIQGSTGAFDPAFPTWTPAQVQAHLKPLYAIVGIPKCAAPPCIVPLVVIQHGIGGAATQMLPVFDAIAQRGAVVAAIDLPMHGERSFCSANDQCVAAGGGAGVCTPDPTLQTPSDATAPGRCAAGNTLKMRPDLAPVASGNFFISSNFFRVRDAFRQSLIDQSALTLALARPPSGVPQPPANPFSAALQAAGVVVDPTKVYFAGFSLGGFSGTPVVATNPRFSRASFTAPGGTIVDVFTTGSYKQYLGQAFGPLGIDVTKVFPTNPDGSPNPNYDPAQAAKYAQLLSVAKWILDPADPINFAANVVTKTYDPRLEPLVQGGLGSATTVAYGQMTVGDQTVPNPYTQLYLGLAGLLPARTTVYTAADTIAPEARHELLLRNFLPATDPRQQAGDVIRGDLASFLATGAVPAPARNVP